MKHGIKLSVAMTAAIAFSAIGCKGGYKSRVYSDKEIQAYIAKTQPKQDGPTAAKPLQEGPAQPETSGSTNTTTLTTTTPPADGSQPSGPQVVYDDASQFIISVTKLLTQKSAGAEKTVHGIDLLVNPATTGATVAAQVIVSVSEKLYSITIDSTAIQYQEGAAASQLSVQATEVGGTDASDLGDAVKVYAACSDHGCNDVYVAVTVADTSGSQTAAFDMHTDGTTYSQVRNSINDAPVYASVAQAQADIEAAAAQLQVANSNGNGSLDSLPDVSSTTSTAAAAAAADQPQGTGTLTNNPQNQAGMLGRGLPRDYKAVGIGTGGTTTVTTPKAGANTGHVWPKGEKL